MPELPEVETVMRGLVPHLNGVIIHDVVVRCPKLRWPIPSDLNTKLNQQTIINLSRRGKYLLMQLSNGTLIIHLGMSGSLRLFSLNPTNPPKAHDHLDLVLSNHMLLRYNDPRRFGAILWTEDNPHQHKLLKTMGIEPFDINFTGAYLKHLALKRRTPIKSFIMNNKIVVGVGNIYAAEALFLAGIHPLTPSNLLTTQQCDQLASSIKTILSQAISNGGTTLKDFINSEGKPGYFSQKLHVYGRAGLPCTVCQSALESIKLGQRSTVFCATCQPLIDT
ncbi:MAG: bifunctional DNA-formamidopyrimidine glycosylase/DNA-(apurinic or apyrimidinic site) lyase [Legionellaceae bacterium]|nr:bifunctional DNA-formamidopyrimidine glycosylase/DNA-(apurinic or apyrimidinic site) lyase [Legionellaceae bacterium]